MTKSPLRTVRTRPATREEYLAQQTARLARAEAEGQPAHYLATLRASIAQASAA